MRHSEAYLDIVWRQFKKNRAAHWSLCLILPLLLVAIFAPALASNEPFAFYEGGQTLFPWLRALFNPKEISDYVFNMALIGFLPWLALAALTNVWAKRQGRPGRQRMAWILTEYLLIIAALSGIFASDRLRPENRYSRRNFAAEEFRSPKTGHGFYAPIPFGTRESDLDSRYRPPLVQKDPKLSNRITDGAAHWLGTDDNGRDVLAKMIYGTRISLTVGLVSMSITLSIGIALGALAGYFGGKLDILISRLIEIVQLFPAFFLILTLIALIGQDIYIIMAVIGLTSWPTVARLTRGEVLKQRSIDYVIAAKALGSSELRIVFRHILPNAISPALVAAPFGIASAIITEAGLSLLGFGVRPPTPTWGGLLNLGSNDYQNWWLVVMPGLAIFFTVTILNLIGSGLRDAMDPKLRM